MSVNPQPVEVQPYRPSLYLPGSLARFRQYPRVVQTPIPGAGYNVGKGVWGEQVLYLGGYGDLFNTHGGMYPYGQYAQVPLRGLGQTAPVTPWYARTWVWGVAGVGALAIGIGAYMTLGKLRRNGRRRKRRLEWTVIIGPDRPGAVLSSARFSTKKAAASYGRAIPGSRVTALMPKKPSKRRRPR